MAPELMSRTRLRFVDLAEVQNNKNNKRSVAMVQQTQALKILFDARDPSAIFNCHCPGSEANIFKIKVLAL